MKVIEFTIPVARENAVVVQDDENLPHFYNHLHRHIETQITWIVKGQGTLIAGDYMQRFKSGDIYILGSNQPHIFKSDPVYFDEKKKMGVHSLNIFFSSAGAFASVLNIPEANGIKKFIGETVKGLQVPEAESKNVAKQMLNVKNEKEGFRLAAFIRLLQQMALIKNWKTLAAVSDVHSFSDQEGLRMNDVYQYTMAHYANNISLKKIAEIACLTPQAFCRYFKKHTRKTFIEFLNEVRINEACKKIVSGDFESISSIAYDTGFSSAVSFNRVFKKITNKSPRQYLQEYKQKID